jgi:signal transduction histidine kinase
MALREGRAVGERWHVKRDGSRFWGNGVMTPLFAPDTGKLRGFGKILRDQTEQKRTEDALQASETRFRTLFESMDEGYLLAEVLFDEDGDGRGVDILYTEANPAATKMIGLDLTGLRLSEVDRSYEPYWYEIWSRVARTGGGERLERYAAPLGVWFDFYVFKPGGAEAVAAGDTTQVAVVFRDVTERRKTEQALEAAAVALRQANETLEARVAERTRVLEAQAATLEEQAAVLREQAAELARTNEARQALLQRVVVTEEQERRRISRELHDQTGQHLTGLALGLKALEETLAVCCPQEVTVKEILSPLRSVAQELARDLHHIAVELRPTALDDLGLLPALRTYVHRWSETSGIDVDFDNFGIDGKEVPEKEEGGQRLPEIVETTVYRVVQEALTNTSRHGKHAETRATHVSVTLQRRGRNLQVTIEDDGPGFDVEAARRTQRLGLVGMAERAFSCKGTLDIESEPGRGTSVILRVPVA